MAEAALQTLAALPPLGHHDETIGGVRVTERVPGIVSAAVPREGEAAFAAALRNGYDLDVPAVGRSHARNGVRVAMLQPGQAWIVTDGGPDTAIASARAALGDAAWLVDQSDAWAALRVSGRADAVRRTLERICMLDLDAFADGMITRTLMEHLGVDLAPQELLEVIHAKGQEVGQVLHPVQQVDVRACDPAVQNVATDRDRKTGEVLCRVPACL